MADDANLLAAIAKALEKGAGTGGENANARRDTDRVVDDSQTTKP